MRRLVAAGVALVPVLSLAMLGATAVPAGALTAPPRPIAVPSSVLGGGDALFPNDPRVVGTLDNMSAPERARRVGNAVPQDVKAGRLPASVSSSSLAKGAGGAFVAGSGFSIGYTIGATALSVVGIRPDGSSCTPIWQGVGADSCAGGGLAPAPDYVPNTDVVATEPGWASEPYLVSSWAHTTGGPSAPGDFRVAVEAAPAFGAATGTTSLSFAVVTPPPVGGNYTMQAGLRIWCKQTDGTLATGYFTSRNHFSWDASKTGSTMSTSTPCSNAPGAVFDHITIGAPDANTPMADWFPEGHTSRPPEPDMNPERAWEMRGTCRDGVAAPVRSGLFRETDTQYPEIPSLDCTGLGPVVSGELWEVVPGNVEMDVLVSSWDAATGLSDLDKAFPDCWDGTCVLELQRIDQGAALSCFSDPAACVDWYTDPLKADKYQCLYAGNVVALDQCRVYAPTFNVATGTDVLVDTETGTKRVPATGIEPYADPVTGTPQPKPGEEPAPEQSDGCPPKFGLTSLFSGYWIYKGSLCALKEAFVPTPGFVEAEWNKQDIDFCRNAAGSVFCTVGDVLGPFFEIGNGDESNCLGWAVNPPAVGMLEGMEIGTWYPFQACEPPTSTISTFWLAFSTAAIYLGAGLYGAKILARTIGAGDAVA